jgi:uncharacterized protein YndB with AHSA1/START domain
MSEALAISRTAFPLTMQYVFYADMHKVFDAFTQKALVDRWCDGGGFVDPVENGVVEFFNGWVKGVVKEADRMKGLLIFTWKPSEWDRKLPESIVRIQLNPHPAGCEINLEHGGFPSREESDKHLEGWTDHVFEPMNDFFTGISPLSEE